MSFVGICLAICFVVALIGPSKIFKIIAIGIPIVIVLYVILNRWFTKSMEKDKAAREKYESRYYNVGGRFSEGYETRQIITGDYFSYKYDMYAGTSLYCRYSNCANCVNCSRRKEYYIDGKYFYGVSENCQTYNYDD